jgi:chromosome segregation ATPase
MRWSPAAPERVVRGLSESAEEVRQLETRKPDENFDSLRRQIASLKDDLAKANDKLAGLERVKQDLEHALNDKPPIIKVAEAGKDGKKVRCCFETWQFGQPAPRVFSGQSECVFKADSRL